MAPADAAAGQQQAIDLARHEAAVRNVVGIDPCRTPLRTFALGLTAAAGIVDVDGKAGAADHGVRPLAAARAVVARQVLYAQDASRLADSDRHRHRGDVRLFVARRVFADEIEHLVGLLAAFEFRPREIFDLGAVTRIMPCLLTSRTPVTR